MAWDRIANSIINKAALQMPLSGGYIWKRYMEITIKMPGNGYNNETATYTADKIVEADIIQSTATVNSGRDIVYKGALKLH